MLVYEKELKMPIQKIRASINLKNNNWVNMYTTNCYAYGLGLDISENKIKDFAYIPGTIANSEIDLSSFDVFSYKDLIYNLYLDFETLGIAFREIRPLDDIDENEWKIALFLTEYYGKLEDYHFVRQHDDGIWYHKNGYDGNISKYDSYGQLITNPEECFLRTRKYNKCFSLTLKK